MVLLGLGAPTRPRLAQLAFLVVLAFLLTTKVWSPQYSVWLVPLLALARPRWGLNLLWQFTEIAVWIATLLWLLGYYDSARGLDYGALMILLLVRDGLLIAIAVLVVREMWHPELDIVRAGGMDDPCGGPFDERAGPVRRPTAGSRCTTTGARDRPCRNNSAPARRSAHAVGLISQRPPRPTDTIPSAALRSSMSARWPSRGVSTSASEPASRTMLAIVSGSITPAAKLACRSAPESKVSRLLFACPDRYGQ